MGADQHHDWRGLATSALDWWRDAGVDALVDDAPRDWLARVRSPAPAVPEPAAPEAPGLPPTLPEFLAWRTGGDAPEARWGGIAVASEGDPTSALMIVVDMPGEAGLVDGAPGRLFDAMLAAIGRSRDDVYLAALACVRPMGGRIPPEDFARLAELLGHHVALAAPRRLLTLGQAASRAIHGTDGAVSPNSLRTVNLNGVTVETVASLHPRFLLERPELKAKAWRDLQLLVGGLL